MSEIQNFVYVLAFIHMEGLSGSFSDVKKSVESTYSVMIATAKSSVWRRSLRPNLLHNRV